MDDYEKMLQREHQGWSAALREESQRLPMDGDEGGRQGQLMKNLKVQVYVLEEELDLVNKMVTEGEERSCLLAALNMKEMGEAEGDQLEVPGEQKVLQTQTVPLNEVMANLPEWVEALRAEYMSLTEGTNAIKPVHKDTLRHRTDVEYAPGKLVATVKPGNRKKARLVVCGNRVEVSADNQVDQDGSSEYANRGRKGYDTYAGGVDGVYGLCVN